MTAGGRKAIELAQRDTQTSSWRSNAEWLAVLRMPGPERYWAVVELRSHLSRATLFYLVRHRNHLQGLGRSEVVEFVEECVQEALVVIDEKLNTFQGDSRFTTWANLVAINVVARKLRCHRRESHPRV